LDKVEELILGESYNSSLKAAEPTMKNRKGVGQRFLILSVEAKWHF